MSLGLKVKKHVVRLIHRINKTCHLFVFNCNVRRPRNATMWGINRQRKVSTT